MKALYFTALGTEGKTTICAGIGKSLKEQGKRVGYFRPVRLTDKVDTGLQDVLFMKDILNLQESPESLSPVALSRSDLQQALSGDASALRKTINQNYGRLSADKHITLIEGLGNLGTDTLATELCRQVADITDAGLIVLVGFSQATALAQTVDVCRSLGKRLLGIIVNFVPQGRLQQAATLKTSVEKEGITVFGTLPDDRTLMGISIGELAEAINGTFMEGDKDESGIVENFMLGAMSLDPATNYFSRMSKKAVVVRGNRPDLQLAALQTPTSCLVLTGNTPPVTLITYEAKNRGIPIIITDGNTTDTMAKIETALIQEKFHCMRKLEKLTQVLSQYLDFPVLHQRIGLSSQAG